MSTRAGSLWAAALMDLGRWLAVPAAMNLVMVPCAWVLDGWRAALVFAALGVGTGVGAALVFRFTSPEEHGEALEDSVGAAAIGIGIAWLIFVSVCAVPFFSMAQWHSGAAPYAEVVDALFESISGLTTCGMSMAPDANTLPHTLQLWRSLLQWVGGVGVIVLALTFLRQAADPEAMVGAEVGRSFAEDAEKTAKRIWAIYGVLSVLIFVGYLAAGMHWWESLNHAMATVSTGGFAVTSDSFASYGWGPRAVACVGMIAAAISFAFYDDLVRTRFARALQSVQTWALLGVLVVGMGVMGLFSNASWGQLLFQWCSAVTTCGLTTTGTLEEWTPIVLVILATAMAMGGCAGSTTGGFKTLRVTRALAALRMRVWSSAGGEIPTSDDLVEGELEDEDVRKEMVRQLQAGNFIFLYLLCWLLTMMLLAWTLEEDYAVGPLLFESASALSAVGLSAGLVSGDMPTSAKIVLEIAMWVGRLEVVGGLALVFGLLRSVSMAFGSADDSPSGEEDDTLD